MQIPFGLDDVTPEWLTQALRSDGILSDASITSIEADRFGEGITGVIARLSLTYSQPEQGAPDSLIIKLGAEDPEVRKNIFEGISHYQREVQFFREASDRISLRIPRCYYADLNIDNHEVVLLLEDLAPSQSPSWEEGCTLEQATQAIHALARLHADWWCSPELERMDWLFRFSRGQFVNIRNGFKEVWHNFYRDHGGSLPDRIIGVGERLAAGGGGVFERWADGLPTLCHCDYKVDNLLFGSQGANVTFAVIDWQLVGEGPGISDLAYFLSGSVTSSIRKANEAELVRFYHNTLTSGGVTDYDFSTCWEDYCLWVLNRLVRLATVIPYVKGVSRTTFLDILLPRCCNAIIDLDADELV